MVTRQNVSDCLRVRYYFTLASCYFESWITKIITETFKVLTYRRPNRLQYKAGVWSLFARGLNLRAANTLLAAPLGKFTVLIT